MDGKFVAYEDATIHVLSHVVHYGSGVFEGIRCYETSRGPAVFRLKEHLKRLYDSSKVYRMEVPYSPEEISDVILETIKINNLSSCYIRPLFYRGLGELGVSPLPCPVNCMVAVWSWGSYLGDDAHCRQGYGILIRGNFAQKYLCTSAYS